MSSLTLNETDTVTGSGSTHQTVRLALTTGPLPPPELDDRPRWPGFEWRAQTTPVPKRETASAGQSLADRR
jgi:hypothetical protein